MEESVLSEGYGAVKYVTIDGNNTKIEYAMKLDTNLCHHYVLSKRIVLCHFKFSRLTHLNVAAMKMGSR